MLFYEITRNLFAIDLLLHLSGNPRVTPEVTRDVCLLARMMAANLYFSQIEDLMFEVLFILSIYSVYFSKFKYMDNIYICCVGNVTLGASVIIVIVLVL